MRNAWAVVNGQRASMRNVTFTRSGNVSKSDE